MSAIKPTRGRNKPRLTLKKLKHLSKKIPLNIPTHSISTAEITLATFDSSAHESHSNISPIMFSNQVTSLKKKPEIQQISLQNMLVETQPTPYAAYKSTLANLSEALATLNEGEYLQWEGYGWKSPKAFDKMREVISSQINTTQTNMVSVSVTKNRSETPLIKNKQETGLRVSGVNEKLDKSWGGTEKSEDNEKDDREMSEMNKKEATSTEMVGKNDIRWKECSSLGEDLEFLKTEESLEALKQAQKKNDAEANTLKKEKYKRSASVKNRRTLMQEFIEWKEATAINSSLFERKGSRRGEVSGQDKKGDLVLPRLNIGDQSFGSVVKQTKEGEPRKHKWIVGEAIKPHIKNGLMPQINSRRKLGELKMKEEYSEGMLRNNSNVTTMEEKKDKSEANIQDSKKNLLEPVEESVCMNKKKSAGVAMWNEEEFKSLHKRILEERILTEDRIPPDHWKLQGFVPRIKIKRDYMTKKHLVTMKQREISAEEGRELSKDNLREFRVEAQKALKPLKEAGYKIPLQFEEYRKKNGALGETLIAQTIMDHRMRTAEGKNVINAKEVSGISEEQERRKGIHSRFGLEYDPIRESYQSQAKEDKRSKKVEFILNCKSMSKKSVELGYDERAFS